MEASLHLIAVHTQVQKEYGKAYAKTITPYVAILKQVMQANGIQALEALAKLNNNDFFSIKETGNPKKDNKEKAVQYQKQRLFISAALTLLNQEAT